MMWLMSAVTHFLTDVSLGTFPNFSKGWCVRELICVISLFIAVYSFNAKVNVAA